jgi:hypothetical protein
MARRRSKTKKNNRGGRAARRTKTNVLLRRKKSEPLSLHRKKSVLSVSAPRRSRIVVHKSKVTRSKQVFAPGANLVSKAHLTVDKRMSVCAKRKVRKQVLHATGFSGKNGARNYRFSSSSKIKC